MSATQHLQGDCRKVLPTLPERSVHCCVTSPPYYGLRDYGAEGQIGLEDTPKKYVENMVEVFRLVRKVLRDDGTLWLNLGDSYAGSGKGRNADGTHQEGGKQGTNKGTIIGTLHKTEVPEGLKPKDLIGIPWRVVFALQADGWYLRSDIIWHKPNCMPESVTDRPTKAHEYIFLLAKSERYYYDHSAIAEQAVSGLRVREKANGECAIDTKKCGSNSCCGISTERRNKRSVWRVATQPYAGAHFAVFPPELIRPCVRAGCPVGGTILDPFGGSGTTALVAEQENRNAVLIELNGDYIRLQKERTAEATPL